MKFLKLALILSAFVVITAQAQTSSQLNSLQKKYQACLDKGTNMLGCSHLYYNQMDSVLNVVYKKLRQPMNAAEKTSLKNEQLNWLNSRDAYFKKVEKENGLNGSEPAGKDHEMIAMQDKALFVKGRVEVLLKRLKS